MKSKRARAFVDDSEEEFNCSDENEGDDYQKRHKREAISDSDSDRGRELDEEEEEIEDRVTGK